MGNSHYDIQDQGLFKQFNCQQWKRQKDEGLFQLWQNNKTGELCQAYKLDYVPRQQQLQHYRFRHYNQNADNFVQIRYIDIQKNPSLCSYGQSYVLTQYIPVKLIQMDNLTHLQGYSILRASYRAFHTMQAFHGPFIPDQSLIGVNLNGKPKIWLNKNHSKNRAEKTIEAQIWQKHMGQVSQNVKRILQMVEQKTVSKRYPQQFRQYFYNNIMNFAQASSYVQDYCQNHRINIPSTINYSRFIQDTELVQIINKYKSSRINLLNYCLNTFELNQNNQQLNQINNVNLQNSLLRKNQSHRTLTYYTHQNRFVQPQYINQAIKTISNNNQNNGAINFTIHPTRHINSPIIQRVKTSPVLNRNNYNSIILNQNVRPISQHKPTAQIINIRPEIPIHLLNPVPQLASAKQLTAVQSMPLHQTKLVPKKYFPVFQNMRTPQHITNNTTFVPPNKITSFEQATRKIQLTDKNISSEIQNHSQEKLNQNLHNNQLQNNNQLQKSQSAQSIHQKIYEFEQDEAQGPLHRDIAQKKSHPQQLQNYISGDSQYNYKIAQSYDNDHTSQPDWQNIQRQHQNLYSFNKRQEKQSINMMHSFGGQVEEQYSEYQVNSHDKNHLKLYQNQQFKTQISRIQNSNNCQQHFVDQHFAMFKKFAKGDHSRENIHQVDQIQDATQKYQARNIQLNQSGNIESGEQQNFEQQDNINSSSSHENKQFLNNTNALQTPELESSQRIWHLSSKNTSINKGHLGGQSSGTLVIHDSRQNIYQGVNQQQRPMKVLINNIRQQSHESEPQDYQPYVVNSNQNGSNKGQNQMFYDQQQQNLNQQQYYQQSDNIRVEQRNYLNQKQLGRRQQYYEQNDQQYVNKSSQDMQKQDHRKEDQTDKLGPNQYENLHFRNQSHELYQYTPVDSVYNKHTQPLHNRQQTFNGYQPYNIQSTKAATGVKQIVQLQRHEDIEQYIKNKYANIIGKPGVIASKKPQVTQNQYSRPSKQRNVHRAMTFAKLSVENQNQNFDGTMSISKHYVFNENGNNEGSTLSKRIEKIERIQSKCYPITSQRDTPELNKKLSSNKHSGIQDMDFLDVGNLQKSLDQKYKSLADQQDGINHTSPRFSSPNYQVKHSQTMSEDDGMNVAALQKKLLKFQQRQSIQRQKSQRKLQTINDESVNNNTELNFHELDNIVQLMDRKIQQSQKKQQLSSSSRREKQENNISEFQQNCSDPLHSVQLQASISNRQMALHNMPILREEHISNVSNSNPTSTRQNHQKFGMDSQDFATGRDKRQYGFNSSLRMDNIGYSLTGYSQRKSNNNAYNYEQKYAKILSPVVELDKRYQNYQSKSYSTINEDYNVDLNLYYMPQYKRKSQRRSTLNNSDVKRLTDNISDKYDKYINTKKGYTYQLATYQSGKLFAKKPNYQTVSYQSTSSRNTPNQSKVSRKTNSEFQRKRSSYLNTITELQGEYNHSPYKQQALPRRNQINNTYDLGQQNYLNLSNKNSNNGSKQNISDQNSGRKSSSKITYDQLRDLLWK